MEPNEPHRGRGRQDRTGETDQAPTDLQDFASFLVRRRTVIIAFVVLGALVGLALSLIQSSVYSANTLLRVQSSAARDAAPNDQLAASTALALTYSRVISDDGFLEEAAPKLRPRLGLDGAELRSRVSATVVTDTSLIRLVATGPSRSEARTLAQSLADYVVKRIVTTDQGRLAAQTQRLSKRINALSARIATLLENEATATAAADTLTADRLADQRASLDFERRQLQTQYAELVATGSRDQVASISNDTPAVAEVSRVEPRPAFNIALGLFLGLVIGLVLAWLRDQLDRSVHTVSELERTLGAATLGVVPAARDAHDRRVDDVFERVRVGVELALNRRRALALALSPVGPRAGAPVACELLGRAFARAGMRVVIVDADLRDGALTTAMGVGDEPDGVIEHGFAQLLSGKSTVDQATIALEDRLTLVPAGASNEPASALLGSTDIVRVMRALRARFDIVLLVTAAAGERPDAVVLGSRCNGLAIVTRLGSVERAQLSAAVRSLRGVRSELLGAIVFSSEADIADLASRGEERRFTRPRLATRPTRGRAPS